MEAKAEGQQQAIGVEQISVEMQNINQATAQTLATVSQSEKAAQDLNDLARHLARIVQWYNSDPARAQ
jgi:methyl-accepting chemotaxis protein